jgi:hypothetical protein
MVLAGCDSPTGSTGSSGGGADPFAGTWEGVLHNTGLGLNGVMNFRVVAENSKFSSYATSSFPKFTNREIARGTYQVSGTMVSITQTEALEARWNNNGDIVSSGWVSVNYPFTVNLTGNSFIMDGITFTKTSP